MLVNITTGLAGVLIFLFIFWKRLKEDYSSEIIFRSGGFVILGILLGGLIALKFFPGAFLWSELLGSLAGLGLAVYKFRIRFYESFEAVVVASLPWISFLFLKDSVTTSSFTSFMGFLSTLIIIFIYYFLDLHYKNFTWYKSGKIGFSGLAALSLIFITRAAIAIFTTGVLSFLDKYEAIVSGAAAFICFLLIFNLGRSGK